MTAHATLPPSGAAAWVACAQWPTMNKLYGGEDTAATLEGRAAHAIAAKAVQFGADPLPQVGELVEGVPVTAEMIEGAQILAADVAKLVGPGDRLYVEHTLRPSSILHPEVWGTPDVVLRRPDGSAVIWDYKFGHARVEAVRNWQLACYAALLEVDEVEFRIVQPRCYEAGGPVRVWKPTPGELPGMWADLRRAATAAMESGRQATPGLQCRYCPGRHACSALQQAGGLLSDFADAAQVLELPAVQAGRELAYLRQALSLLEVRASGLEAQVKTAWERGERDIGWAVERSSGRKVWSVPVERLRAVADLTGVNLFGEPSPITPTQAVKAGLPVELVEAMSERKAGAEKLVPAESSQAFAAFFKE